jgi:hypothetical protein
MVYFTSAATITQLVILLNEINHERDAGKQESEERD